jgi:hypothetical protein
MQENRHGQYVVREATSSATQAEKLRTRIRYVLDTLAEHVSLPHGTTLHGRLTNDHHGNLGLYVFLRDAEGTIHPGVAAKHNDVRYIPETVGGHWISMNKGDGNINYSWEARDLNLAIADYRTATGK